MSESLVLDLWCFIEGGTSCFNVKVPGNESIFDLKKRVKEKGALRHVDAANLVLYKVSAS
jgi:hypothetical protein